MDECVFCKIVSNELPNHTIYEDEHTLAFLDIRPTTEGHVVVIPKKHSEQIWDLDDQLYQHVLSVGKRVAKHLRMTLKAFRVAMVVEGMEVPHGHLNIFPINVGIKQTLNDKVVSEPDHDKLAKLALRLHLE